MQLTKRNHYTPCFWAALWNETYYRSFLAGTVKGESVRDQPVHALSVKSGRLLETTVGNVHFDKNLGMAEITRESAEDFVKRHHPDKFEEFARTNATAKYPVFLDIVDILSGLERTSWRSQNAFCRARQTSGSKRRWTTSSDCSSCSSRKESRTTEIGSIEPP